MKYLLLLLSLLVLTSCQHSGRQLSAGEYQMFNNMFNKNLNQQRPQYYKPAKTNCIDYGSGYISCSTY